MPRSDSIKNKTDEEIVDFLSLAPGHSHEISAQAEMMRRLKNTIQDLDKNTMRYSRRLIDLTILLFFVAFCQVLISIMAVPLTWLARILLGMIVLYSIYFITRRIIEKKN